MEDEDIDYLEVSFGSITSLQRLEDDSQYQEKPKCGKSSTDRDHSPYHSQSTRGMIARPGHQRNTGHKAWSTAIRNGFAGISSENSSYNWMASSQVQKEFKTNHSSLPGPFSRDEHVLASGRPAYKSQEDYYDEVIELRQVIRTLKTENGVLKTKLQRITQENVLKDRQIKDFLNPNKQPEEIRRTLTDKNADSSLVVSSLKQKLHVMERNVKDKENELRRIRSDVKSTNAEELRVQVETYYEETRRLQTVLSSVYSHKPGTKNIMDARSSRCTSWINTFRREELGRNDRDDLQRILDENRKPESENQSLKKDLLHATDGQRIEKKSRLKEKNVDYADMNRVQMMRKISELEQLLADSKGQQKNERNNYVGENTSEEMRKQREIIENLKKDRTHYHEEADKLRTKLGFAVDEVAELKARLKKIDEEQKRRKETALPIPRQCKTGATGKKISFRGIDEQQDDLFSGREDEAARVLQRNWRRHQKNTLLNKDTSLALLQIQSALRAHFIRHERIQLLGDDKDNEEDDLEWGDAVTRVQAAMRGHHARHKYFSNTEFAKLANDQWSSELSDVSDMKERKMFKQQSFLKKSPASRRALLTDPKILVDSEDSDDDVVIGGSRQNLRIDASKSSTSHDLAPVRNQKFFKDKQSVNGTNGQQKPDSDDSDDNVQTSTRFDESVPQNKKRTSIDENGFGNSSTKKHIDERRLREFSGKESKQKDEISNGVKLSLDNLFTTSRSTKQGHVESEPESEPGKISLHEERNTKEKPSKSLFSWGNTKRNATINAPIPASRKKIAPEAKFINVWSSRLSEDSDDDDDVVVTAKTSRKSPTKTASLLDELF